MWDWHLENIVDTRRSAALWMLLGFPGGREVDRRRDARRSVRDRALVGTSTLGVDSEQPTVAGVWVTAGTVLTHVGNVHHLPDGLR